MKKKFSYFALILLVCLALTACAQKLPDGFDKAAVENSAKSVIEMINSQDSDSIRNMSIVEMKNALTDNVFSQIYSAINVGGSFKQVKSMTVAGTTDKNTGTDYAVVVAKAEYEKKSFTYTITFTKDMKLAGLYYK